MACCAEHCRFETNDQAAQKACDQSRQALSQPEILSGPTTAPVLAMVKSLPDSGPLLPVDLATRHLIHPTPQIKEHDPPKRFISVKTFILIHSLLI